jgi:hypothetical protein
MRFRFWRCLTSPAGVLTNVRGARCGGRRQNRKGRLAGGPINFSLWFGDQLNREIIEMSTA